MYGSVIILAGGNSERMNYPKPYLTIGGKTFLERVCKNYFEAGLRDIYAVINKKYLSDEWRGHIAPLKSFVNIVENSNPEYGRTHSLKLGAEQLAPAEYCFIQNVDNPFVSKKVISALWDNKIPDGSAIPSCRGISGHPALVSDKIIREIIAAGGKYNSFRDLIGSFEKKMIEVNDERILYNINTWNDYEKYVLSFDLSEL